MFALKEAVFAAAVEDAFDFLFPIGASGANKFCVASLPVIADEVVELLAGLIEFYGVASEIEQGQEESASIGFVTPELESGDGVAAFAFVEGIVLIAGAVMDFISVDELEILDDEVTPGVVDARLGSFDEHRAGKKFAPGLNRQITLVVVVVEIRSATRAGQDAGSGQKRFGCNCDDGGLVGGDFGVGAIAIVFPRPGVIEGNESVAVGIGDVALREF